MTRRALAGLCAAVLLLAPGPAPAAPRASSTLKVLTLGDSWTIGHGSSDGLGYRRELGARLAAAGIDVTWSAAGTTGWTVQDLAAGAPGWLAANTPDWVILAVGTNNAAGVAPGMSGFEPAYIGLVNTILASSPTVRVLAVQIAYSNAPWAPNEVLVNVAVIHSSWWSSAPARVTLADWTVIHPCLMYDAVHLRDSGYDIAARQLYRALTAPLGLPALTYSDHVPLPTKRPGYDRPPTIPC